tara:strand:- start:22103 stop:22606 length:504 start_codon:yes stop_codon:yes gene_type:complete
MNIIIKCENCGAHGTTLHKMCHGYWDEQTQRMEVFSECEGIDWYCDECETEVGVEEVTVEINFCRTCGQTIDSRKHINWTEAFCKFGYGDGDGEVFTPEIVEHIEKLGLICECSGSMHNTIIDSIKDKDGKELIGESVETGYDCPRVYLPSFLIKHLDAKYNGESVV